MTISSLALAAKKVIEAAWLHGTSYDLASQAAFALESTCMLQSPEKAAELVALRNDALNMRGLLSPNGSPRRVPMPLGKELAPVVEWLLSRVAELEAERHVTNEALDDAVRELRARRESTPAEARYVSHVLPPRDSICARSGCGHSGEEHHHGDTKCWAHLPKKHGDPVTVCGCSGFVAEADGITARIAPTQALLEDPHDSPLHHPYRVGRELPETGGASC